MGTPIENLSDYDLAETHSNLLKLQESKIELTANFQKELGIQIELCWAEMNKRIAKIRLPLPSIHVYFNTDYIPEDNRNFSYRDDAILYCEDKIREHWGLNWRLDTGMYEGEGEDAGIHYQYVALEKDNSPMSIIARISSYVHPLQKFIDQGERNP